MIFFRAVEEPLERVETVRAVDLAAAVAASREPVFVAQGERSHVHVLYAGTVTALTAALGVEGVARLDLIHGYAPYVAERVCVQ